ncbi:MAG TPA: hypothetical protein VNU19_11780, partial [Candidatus Acidoferrum sp.]|nr:hypothetical protein [Candidatus Acidoferrum sp.]
RPVFGADRRVGEGRAGTLRHVALTADAGLTRYDESYADITGLKSVARGRFLKRCGLLTLSELTRLEEQIRIYLGL